MTADNDGRLAVVTFTSQTGQQSSAKEEEGDDGETQDDKRKSDSEFYPSAATWRWNLESNETGVDQI